MKKAGHPFMFEESEQFFDWVKSYIKWYEKILLPFAKTYVTYDIGMDKIVYFKSKKLFSRIYIIKIWEKH